MTNIANYVGVDVSKKTLDIAIPKQDGTYLHKKVCNSQEGFKSVIKHLPLECCCVMEATSSYYMLFAYFLYSQNIAVSIVNPLTINHFCKMRMSRAKTDKKDAAMIAQYGKSETPRLWQPKEAHLLELQQYEAVLVNITAHRTSYNNQLEAFIHSGQMSRSVLKVVQKQIAFCEKQIKSIEASMIAIAEQHHKELLQNLLTIPGLGKRTAMMLIVITDGFQKFNNSKELVSYVGLCPRLYESGTSIKGKGRICKMGMSKLRRLLYLCSMRAIRSNHQCKIMFDRLKERGKNGKLAVVAVANKLIRQAFAIGVSKVSYQANFSIN
jgi:transposase